MQHRGKTENKMGKGLVQVQDAKYVFTYCSGPFSVTVLDNLQKTFTRYNYFQTPLNPLLAKQGSGLCGAVSCQFQFSCFPFFLDTSSLPAHKPELCCSLQTGEVLVCLPGSWETSSFLRQYGGPCSAADVSRNFKDLHITWAVQRANSHLDQEELEAAIPNHRFERDIYKVLKLFLEQTLSACSWYS